MTEPDYGRLPKKAWIMVLQNLDAKSRLSVAALGPKFAALNYCEDALRTVRCGAVDGSDALRRTLEGARSTHVRILCLTNCLFADPSSLLACVGMCEHLSELLCVGCPLDARQLFRLVPERLHKLQRLECSLFCKEPLCCNTITPSYSTSTTSTMSGESSEARTLVLSYMYVEVHCAWHAGFELLLPFVRQCPNMGRLHVHTLRGAQTPILPDCVRFLTSGPDGLYEFTYTTDENVQEMCRVYKDVPESHKQYLSVMSAVGNAAFYLQPMQPIIDEHGRAFLRWGYINAERIKHVLLIVDTAVATALWLRNIAEGTSWSHARRLAVVSSRTEADCDIPVTDSGFPSTCVYDCYRDDLVTFFQAFRAISELNLNAFHFPKDTRFPWIAEWSQLNHVRALSVAPCALRGSRISIAQPGFACPRLEKLDVRSNLIGAPAMPCSSCLSKEPLMFTHPALIAAPVLASQVEASGLQSLTLFKVPGLRYLGFLAVCRLTELRISGVDGMDVHELTSLGVRLSANPNLCKLTVDHVDLPLDCINLWTQLWKLRRLRFLCLLSAIRASRKHVMDGAETLQGTLPSLAGLHVHFQGLPPGGEERLTWLRTRRRDEASSQNASEDSSMLTLVNRPCVECSMSTVVGLRKPRYHDWCDF